MKQKKYSSGIIALIGLGVINVAGAADYSSLSTDELVDMRSQIGEMTTEDRDSYRSEMYSRAQSMSEDERASYQQMNGQGSRGSGDGTGNQYRYGQSGGSGSYGSGYGSRQGGGGRHRQ